jgi:mannose-6-phosphate isomerase
VTRPWGGRRIARRFGWDDTEPRGEWWLASCREDAPSILREGGVDLPTWLDEHGGARGIGGGAAFPLLVKFLDSQEELSLQVHPDDRVASRHGLPRGKTEAWHVLSAEPGAHVFHGTAPGVSGAELLERTRAGADDEEIVSMLRRVDVSPGDTLLVPAGTVHALGAGVTLYEVQQNSDTTYRLHDWGRGREVHLDQASDAIIDHPPAEVRRDEPVGGGWTELVAAPAFALRHARPDRALEILPTGPFALLTVLAGRGTLRAGEQALGLAPGDTLLLFGDATLDGEDLDLLAVDASP